MESRSVGFEPTTSGFGDPRSRIQGEYVRWNNFLDVLPYPRGLGPLLTGQWNLYAQILIRVIIYLVPLKERELPF